MKTILALILSLSFVAPGTSYALSTDLSLMTQARRNYSKGRLDRAIALYNQVNRESEYWLDALEEKASALGRQRKYDETLAILKTVLAPQFEGRISSSPYAIQAITQLKTCDYTGVLKTNKDFKKKFSQRISDLENLPLEQVLKIARKVELTEETLGSLLKKLPRNILRDHRVAQHSAKYRKNGSKEYHLKVRIRYLAKLELKEIAKTIDQLSIAEAEVIHRANALVADSNRGRQGKIEKNMDVLVFPADEEVWFDELGHFKASVENCPGLKRRASL